MRATTANQRRLHADIQRLLATLMLRDISDPRLQGVSITRVEPSKGHHTLNVWVHRFNEEDVKGCMAGLERMKPHFEHELRRAMPRCRIPAIHFAWDKAFDDSGRVLQLLKDLERP
ncbi:MAG TPA: 30S ribosome-binding factor RbfA [Mariprofundaceae bacterium]|nr:30S ribosome-binding factor RbfA [Mariprofundaceae bacterium]